MSLVTMKEILKHADEHKYAVGAFNALSVEAVRGAVRAAEDLNSPLILQLAQVQFDAAPIDLMAPMMIAAAKKSKVPVAVHLDHGEDLETIKRALALGFTSVMFDGASLPLEENIAMTKQAVELAHAHNATCEAELGRVGGSEDGSKDIEMMLTDVEEVKQFVTETGVDALAIAIGNAHGPYKDAPNLQYDRLTEIDNVTDVPLVLHGGSGISVDGFRQSISRGIQKINVATSLQQKVMNDLQNLFERSHEGLGYFDMYDAIEDAMCESVKEHMTVFMSDGRVVSDKAETEIKRIS